MKLKLGFSPCPNDTFIFDALVNGKIDTEGLEFEAVLEDVETLNRWALEERLDVTKLSFPAYFKTGEQYTLLNSGSALGKGVGPLLVSNRRQPFSAAEINEAAVILPGVNTTAHLLFSFAYPDALHKSFGVFHEIEDAVVNNRAALGVIIHENRFTYQDKGLVKVTDLGEYWEQAMKVPIPLGGIVIKRSLGDALYQQVDALIRKSLQYAFDRYPAVSAYVKEHAQAMSEEVMRKHIDLYVNNYSLDLGSEGREAVHTLAGIHRRMHAGV
ncbi:1,4-dihydroxy-6-naphthoate synthase [Niabella drilacis]|uniref:1,4-dihydroxy-6-naphtoate synthase n=1 Tax=Niabella drilacis (strain DSM 25811 / CCM 8410 / CCUG 62505 / LMG 26954 / E90) TaxID=1285928 RepID=A0A1G7BM42_NIADE|nr:1,4-dihydroxy-6-naphthoate synthase [Niabella drilacis]SDE28109.1 1,4-dihydroxy-6-naphthoate synthase [Niabella drilacis]